MSPVPTAIHPQRAERTARALRYRSALQYHAAPNGPAPASLPADVLNGLGKEIVVDWQLPSDMERTG